MKVDNAAISTKYQLLDNPKINIVLTGLTSLKLPNNSLKWKISISDINGENPLDNSWQTFASDSKYITFDSTIIKNSTKYINVWVKLVDKNDIHETEMPLMHKQIANALDTNDVYDIFSINQNLQPQWQSPNFLNFLTDASKLDKVNVLTYMPNKSFVGSYYKELNILNSLQIELPTGLEWQIQLSDIDVMQPSTTQWITLPKNPTSVTAPGAFLHHFKWISIMKNKLPSKDSPMKLWLSLEISDNSKIPNMNLLLNKQILSQKMSDDFFPQIIDIFLSDVTKVIVNKGLEKNWEPNLPLTHSKVKKI